MIDQAIISMVAQKTGYSRHTVKAILDGRRWRAGEGTQEVLKK